MTLYGPALNFYGDPGESAHKQFVKQPGNNTQRRVAQFAKQISERVYESMIFEVALERVRSIESVYELIEKVPPDTTDGNITMRGKYVLTVSSVNADGESGLFNMTWKNHNKTKKKSDLYDLHHDLMRVIYRETRVRQHVIGDCENMTVIGYTEMKSTR